MEHFFGFLRFEHFNYVLSGIPLFERYRGLLGSVVAYINNLENREFKFFHGDPLFGDVYEGAVPMVMSP